LPAQENQGPLTFAPVRPRPAIYLARAGKPRAKIKDCIENKYSYNLSRTLGGDSDTLTAAYGRAGLCQIIKSVRQDLKPSASLKAVALKILKIFKKWL